MFAVHATRETSGANSSAALSASPCLMPRTNVCRRSLRLEFILNDEHCIEGHTGSFKAALSYPNSSITQSVVRNAMSLAEFQLFCPPGLDSGI